MSRDRYVTKCEERSRPRSGSLAWVGIGACLATAACSGDAEGTPKEHVAPETRVSIAHGVFGDVYSWGDAEQDMGASYTTGVRIALYATDPRTVPARPPTVGAATTDVGFYEIAAPAGDYFLCMEGRMEAELGAGACAALHLSDGPLRADYCACMVAGWRDADGQPIE